MITRDTAPNPYWIGLDLGQANDYTALIVAEQIPIVTLPPRYDVAHIERWHPKRYQDVLTRVAEVIEDLRVPVHVFDGDRSFDTYRADVHLIIDRTGVGRAVGDLFVEANLPALVQLVSITSGNAVTRIDTTVGVPKRDLVGAVAVLLQNGRLHYLTESPFTPTLQAELQNFRAKINARGHDSYSAGTPGDDWRDGSHDDLVLALALAVWAAEQHAGGTFADLPAETVAWLEEAYGM